MTNEFDDLKEMHEYAWSLITRGTVDKRSPARHPTLGTNGIFGMPELRTVVLRHADQMAAKLEVHTDLKSRKIEELKINPKVGLHIWFPKNKLQIRLKAVSEIKTGKTLRATLLDLTIFSLIPVSFDNFLSEKPMDLILLNSLYVFGIPFLIIFFSSSTRSLI